MEGEVKRRDVGSVVDVHRGVERWREGGGRERGEEKEVHWREGRSGELEGIERKRAKRRNR